MKVDFICQHASTVAKLTLSRGESVTCEVGSMLAMSPDVHVETTSRSRSGGMLQGLRRMFSGEDFFLNHFTSSREGAELYLAPALIADIVHHPLRHGALVVQGGSWLASGPGVEIDTTFRGLGSTLFSGESMFWVKCTGQGDVLLTTFGTVYVIDVDGDHVVDTGHIVAFEDSLDFEIGKAAPSLIGSLLGGEGLVCRFKGRGRVWCQSHQPTAFGKALGPLLTPVEQ